MSIQAISVNTQFRFCLTSPTVVQKIQFSKQQQFIIKQFNQQKSQIGREQYFRVFAAKTYRPIKKTKKINPQDIFVTFPEWEKITTAKLMKMPQQDLDELFRIVGIPVIGSKEEQVEKLQTYLTNLNSRTYVQKTVEKQRREQNAELKRDLKKGLKNVQNSRFNIEDNISKPKYDEERRLYLEEVRTGLAVTWFGTSSGSPTDSRNVSCIALRTPENTCLVDCGEGTMNQLQKFQLDPLTIKTIFITHLHGDHIFGLPGIIHYIGAFHEAQKSAYSNEQEKLDESNDDLSQNSNNQGDENQEDDVLSIYGPPGLHKLIASTFSYTITKPKIRVAVYEFVTESDGTKDAVPVDPTGMIRFGKLGPKPTSQPVHVKGRLKGVPIVDGSFWEIQTDFGITVQSSQLIHRLPCWGYVFKEEKQNGRKVVLLGDTCNSDTLIPVAKNADMLSHEATFCQGYEEKAKNAMHSTAEMAGNFARKINAKALILTHFSSRYQAFQMSGQGEEIEQDVDQTNQDIQKLVRQAQRTFGYDAVAPAFDGFTYHVPKNKK
eukprot:TRINITY_DN2597_c0_g1_i2.p1 TRINITY_DN2597_c0_g1~~TRINITY_DN2597_c0_g1_i2.p1  ORF type:complete len:559 (-),score=89.17 TRINITY_DN2597_c0_g1_i2:692-2332(-)